MVREGDRFDLAAWLRRVRQEEGVVTTTGDLSGISADTLLNKAEPPKSGVAQPIAIKPKYPPACTVARPAIKLPLPSSRLPRDQSQSLTQQIAKVEAAWRAMKRQSRRTAIYVYLAAVFDLVMEYKEERQIKKLVRYTAAVTGLPAGKNPDPFAAVIRCTSDANVDRKTFSRWSRALRYVAHTKDAETPLKKFMIEAGGVNACADHFVLTLGRRSGNDYSDDRGSD